MSSTVFTARCECGKLSAHCEGVPDSIVQCHCSDCQRKSGSAFGLGGYYPATRVEITGISQRFIRKAASGDDFTQFFCPVCATTLFWITARHPDGLGIAVGAFENLPDTRPVRSVFDENRCNWLEPLEIPTFTRGRDSVQRPFPMRDLPPGAGEKNE